MGMLPWAEKRLPRVPLEHDDERLHRPSSSRRRAMPVASVRPIHPARHDRDDAHAAGAMERSPRPTSFRAATVDGSTPHKQLARPGGRHRSLADRDPYDATDLPGASASPSLVDDMLSSFPDHPSLDRLSPKRRSVNPPSQTVDELRLYGYLKDDDPSGLASRFSLVRPNRARGHTYSTSSSSEYDFRPADRLSRHSRRLSRGRRSNSGSNFDVVLEKAELFRPPDRDRGRPFEGQRALPPPSSPSRSYGRHWSGRTARSDKNSAGSSFDAGYVQLYGSTRWATTFGARSAAAAAAADHERVERHPRSAPHSHPYSHPHAQPQLQPQPSSTGFFSGDAMQARFDADFEAAPTPVVHGGPSRQHSPVRTSVPGSSAGARRARNEAAVGRKLSLWSARDTFLRDAASDAERRTFGPDDAAPSGVWATSRRPPGTSAVDDAPAPGPTVSFGKSRSADAPVSTPRAKERVGFFRRVFEYAKNIVPVADAAAAAPAAPASAPAPAPASAPAPAVAVAVAPTGPGRSISDGLLDSRGRLPALVTADEARQGIRPPAANRDALELDKDLPLSPAAPAPPPPPPAPPLHKKSSFFWRRKRSFSDGRPSQVLLDRPPADALTIPAASGRSLSPVSSLRRVMDPYIAGYPSSMGVYGGSLDRLDATDDERFWRQRIMAHEALLDELDGPSPDRAAFAGRGHRLDGRGGNSGVHDGLASRFHSPSPLSPAHRSRTTTMTTPTAGRTLPDSQVVVNESSATVGAPSAPSALAGTGVGDMAPGITPERIQHSLDTSKSVTAATIPKTPGNSENANGGLLPGKSDRWISAMVEAQDPTQISPLREKSVRSSRIWLQPSSSEEHLPKEVALHDVEDASPVARTSHVKGSAPVHDGGCGDDCEAEVKPVDLGASSHSEPRDGDAEDRTFLVSSSTDVAGTLELSMEEYERARELFDGTATLVGAQTAAAWLGEPGEARTRFRKAYAELFNWAGFSILSAMRELCSRLVLRAETQQVDRILDTVSTRWCDCNPNHGFKSTDVVHTICYSILLLNTDLHMADIEQKMTRTQFIKNTMPTIRRVAEDTAPDSFEPPPPFMQPRSRNSSINPDLPIVKLLTEMRFRDGEDRPSSVDLDRPSRKLSRRRPLTDELRRRSPTPMSSEAYADEGAILVRVPFYGTKKAWEAQVELVLKNAYGSIRRQRLPLCGRGGSISGSSGAPGADASATYQHATNSTLSVLTENVHLKRTPSTLSKAQSENLAPRGRPDVQRVGSTGRWGSKNRSRPKLYPTSTVGSSRTSFDDHSIWTPTNPNSWSRHSLSRTQTSMSANSGRSHGPPSAYRQSIGFANALSQVIVRDDAASEDERVAPMLEDETLGLAGAPWAKEGIVQHKHHLDSSDKRSRDRNWTECFAVVSNGYMRLFSFSNKGASNRGRSRHVPAGAVVGGGNWTENADPVGAFLLRQTIASSLPAPGYSKARPYVWALSFPTGAVHLFQVGTPEIVGEFVSTANYWGARLSKEPMLGGISNIEYGWSEAVVDPALVATDNNVPHPASASGPRPSIQGSVRSSFDHTGLAACRSRLAGDKTIISAWAPPQQSVVASRLFEAAQLQALVAYVKNIEAELQRHNELRSAMLLAFSPRHSNHNKAMANWERKSSHLLREIVKFRTYIDSLTAARAQAEALRASGPQRQQQPEQDAAGPQNDKVQQQDKSSQENADEHTKADCPDDGCSPDNSQEANNQEEQKVEEMDKKGDIAKPSTEARQTVTDEQASAQDHDDDDTTTEKNQTQTQTQTQSH